MLSAIRILSLMLFACGAVQAAAEEAVGQSRPDVVLQRQFTPADRASARYQYLGFDVPSGTRRIRVVQTYDRAGGANAIDLGLFEPGSLDLGSRALRGWSGGARTEVVLAPDSATPGYRPGPLPEGRWHVILQLYKVALAGVDVTLTISIEADERVRGTPSRGFRLQPEGERKWYSGDLHLHTVHSDGSVEPARLLAMAGQAGLEFAAITGRAPARS